MISLRTLSFDMYRREINNIEFSISQIRLIADIFLIIINNLRNICDAYKHRDVNWLARICYKFCKIDADDGFGKTIDPDH